MNIATCDYEGCTSIDIGWIEELGGAFCPDHDSEEVQNRLNRAERRRQTHTSHDACAHAKTKTERQACRRARARAAGQIVHTRPSQLEQLVDEVQAEADANLTGDDIKQMAEESRANPPEPAPVTPAHRNAFETLNTKQRTTVTARMEAYGADIGQGSVYMRTAVLLVESARVGKTSIAKLSDNKVRQAIATAQYLDR